MDDLAPAAAQPKDTRRGMIAREWAKEKARAMRAAMGLPDDPRLERRS